MSKSQMNYIRAMNNSLATGLLEYVDLSIPIDHSILHNSIYIYIYVYIYCSTK